MVLHNKTTKYSGFFFYFFGGGELSEREEGLAESNQKERKKTRHGNRANQIIEAWSYPLMLAKMHFKDRDA